MEARRSVLGLGLGTRIVSFEMTPDAAAIELYAPLQLRRSPITGVRDALSSYQDGRCAYCQTEFTDIGASRKRSITYCRSSS